MKAQKKSSHFVTMILVYRGVRLVLRGTDLMQIIQEFLAFCPSGKAVEIFSTDNPQ